jgi:hypothetical protein
MASGTDTSPTISALELRQAELAWQPIIPPTPLARAHGDEAAYRNYPHFNRAVSNGPWSAKRPEFVKQAKLEINRGIGEIDDWNEASIAARGAALASAAADVWLPPERLRSAHFQERADWPARPTLRPEATTVRSESGAETGGESARVPPLVHAATISWNPPGRGSDMLHRADGARYKSGTGSTGTYEWVVKDGLWAAYFYPGGVQMQTPVVLLAPQRAGSQGCRPRGARPIIQARGQRLAKWRKQSAITLEYPEPHFGIRGGSCATQYGSSMTASRLAGTDATSTWWTSGYSSCSSRSAEVAAPTASATGWRARSRARTCPIPSAMSTSGASPLSRIPRTE